MLRDVFQNDVVSVNGFKHDGVSPSFAVVAELLIISQQGDYSRSERCVGQFANPTG
jgi:hypothetical protein